MELYDEKLDDKIKLAEYALIELDTKFKIFNKEKERRKERNIEHIKTRLKRKEAIKNKLERKGKDFTLENIEKYINDIAGVRIVCPFVADVRIVGDFIKRLEKEGSLEIIEVRDYIKNPKPNGYRSLHFIVRVPVKLEKETKHPKAEIQIRTVAMDFWASLEHQIMYKKKIDKNEEIKSRLLECSDMIALLDQEMFTINEDIKNLPTKH